ncbi:MAG: signal peptidase II [Bifidobacteriaceae bacterium]|nr:signal peptidase II [Bifidobacteriaceae bacterium]
MTSDKQTAKRPYVRVAVFALVTLVAYFADRITKIYAMNELQNGRKVPVFGKFLSFELVRNHGASLSIGSNSTAVISVTAVISSFVLAYFAFKTTSLPYLTALSAAFAGTVGNLTDRIIYADGFLDGPVTDFINYGWSVGNVADIEIVCAAAAMLCMFCFSVPFSENSDKEKSCGENSGGEKP